MSILFFYQSNTVVGGAPAFDDVFLVVRDAVPRQCRGVGLILTIGCAEIKNPALVYPWV